MKLKEQQDQKESQPRLDVPILFSITKEDLEQADLFHVCRGCLIYTALKRRGYPVVGVGGTYARLEVGNKYLFFDGDIGADRLTTDCVHYRPELLGEQIILYPR